MRIKENGIKYRNPLLGQITFLAISVVFLIITVVASVIAAQQQNVTSMLSVSYNANNVSATVTATYQKSGETSIHSLTTPTNQEQITFYATEAMTSRQFSPVSVSVDAQNTYVLFTYSFTNTASIGGRYMKVSLSDSSLLINIDATYAVADELYYSPEHVSSQLIIEDLVSESSLVISHTVPKDVYIAPQETRHFYILISLVDIELNAAYSNNGTSGLIWTIDSAETPNVLVLTRDISQESSAVSVESTLTGSDYAESDFGFLSNISNYVLSSNDEMVKFNKFYYSRVIENNIETIRLSDHNTSITPDVHPAFSNANSNHQVYDLDCVYIGQYESNVKSNVAVSQSGLSTTTGRTMAAWRTLVKSKGQGWNLTNARTNSMIQMLAIAKNKSVALTEENYFGLQKIVGGYWEFSDGIAVDHGVAYLEDDINNYDAYNNYHAVGHVSISQDGQWNIKMSYFADYPWLMMPDSSQTNLKNPTDKTIYYGCASWIGGSKAMETVTTGAMGNDDKGLFSYCYNDGKMTEGGSGYYTSRLLYLPFDSMEESISALTWKEAFSYSEDSDKAYGIKTYTDSTTYTYRYLDAENNVVVGDTITENNTLRYWLHIPFNYNSSIKYPVITYFTGSGGAIYLQQTEHSAVASTLNYSAYQEADTYALRQLAAPNSEGNTIKSILFDDGSIKTASAMGGSWDSNFVSAWFNKVKQDQSYDCFFIIVQVNDELWFENRATYTKVIGGVEKTLKALDIHNAYLAGEEYGSTLVTSKGSYNHSYIASKQDTNIWFQLVYKLHQSLIARYSIDASRQYLVGGSLGGVSVYDMISHFPNTYAAIVSCSAAGGDVSSENANAIKNTRILAYHGTTDSWVSFACSENLVNAVNLAGGSAEFRNFNGGHSTAILSSDFEYISNFLFNSYLRV